MRRSQVRFLFPAPVKARPARAFSLPCRWRSGACVAAAQPRGPGLRAGRRTTIPAQKCAGRGGPTRGCGGTCRVMCPHAACHRAAGNRGQVPAGSRMTGQGRLYRRPAVPCRAAAGKPAPLSVIGGRCRVRPASGETRRPPRAGRCLPAMLARFASVPLARGSCRSGKQRWHRRVAAAGLPDGMDHALAA